MFCPPEFHTLAVVEEITKSVKTTQRQLDHLSLSSQVNLSGLNVIVDLAFIDFTCSSDYLYMWKN